MPGRPPPGGMWRGYAKKRPPTQRRMWPIPVIPGRADRREPIIQRLVPKSHLDSGLTLRACPGTRWSSELQRSGMANPHVLRLGRAVRPDLAQRRLQFVDHQVDDVAGSIGAERAEPPQERLAGQRPRGAERK